MELKIKRENKKYLAWIRSQPCCVSGRESIPHHVRDIAFIPYEFAGGTGLKPYDYMAIPLYPAVHDMAHNDPVTFFGSCQPTAEIIKHLVKYIEEHDL